MAPWGGQGCRGAGRAGVQGWCTAGTGKLPCRLSARARGRRSLPRAVCSGSVPRGAGTTSNRAEPGRCLREGTEMLTVPPGAGHPRGSCRHLIAWPTQVASRAQDHPVADAGAQGMLARGLSAVHVPLSPLPCAQGCTLHASTALSAQSLVHGLHVCPWEGWLHTGHTKTLSSSSQSQLPSSALLFGCCSWGGVRQVAPHGPPNSALLGLLQDGVLRSQVPQPAPCCHSVLRCQGCHHHWVTG